MNNIKIWKIILIYVIFKAIDLVFGFVAGKSFMKYYTKKLTEEFDI